MEVIIFIAIIGIVFYLFHDKKEQKHKEIIKEKDEEIKRAKEATLVPDVLVPTPEPVVVPVVDDVKELRIKDINVHELTKNSVKIMWELDKNATGQVVYGETMELNQSSAKEDSYNYSKHIQLIKDLKAGTQYFYKTVSRAEDGSIAVSSVLTFTTVEEPVVKEVIEFKLNTNTEHGDFLVTLDDKNQVESKLSNIRSAFVGLVILFKNGQEIDKELSNLITGSGKDSEVIVNDDSETDIVVTQDGIVIGKYSKNLVQGLSIDIIVIDKNNNKTKNKIIKV